MAKPASLDIDLNEITHQPPASTAPRAPRLAKLAQPEAPAQPKNDTPVNFRWPAAEVKAMKREALEADQTIQEFLLSCFHSFLQNRKQA